MIKKVIITTIILGVGLSLIFVGLTFKVVKTQCGRSRKIDYSKVREDNHAALKRNHQFEEITVTTEDNVVLSASLIQRQQAKRLIVLCHGRWQAKEYLYPLADIFKNDTLVFFDFRAHGSSEGTYVSLGYHETKDICAILKAISLDSRINSLPIVGIGFSMGGASLLQAASLNPIFKALIIDSAFADLDTQMSRLYARTTKLPLWLMPLSKWVYEFLTQSTIGKVSPRKIVQSLSIPLLIIHSRADLIIPADDAYDLYDNAKGFKQLWITDKGRHASIYKEYPQDYGAKIEKFLNSLQSYKFDE